MEDRKTGEQANRKEGGNEGRKDGTKGGTTIRLWPLVFSVPPCSLS
jgi:hypothetical protein